ncbi:MAG: ATP-grasp domain-containing protein [Promethearchaeota archaeon]
MVKKTPSILVVGFNSRPLAYSLNKAGYNVFAVDFFGDLDLYPHVKDSIIVINRLNSNYNLIKDKYDKFLAKFTLEMLKKYKNFNFFLIGSGLDDAYKIREFIYKEFEKENPNILNVNNSIEAIRKARDIDKIYEFLKFKGYKIPFSYSFDKFEINNLNILFPFILKKKKSSGGINVFKITNNKELKFFQKQFALKRVNLSEWFAQEFIDGLPISCTIISDGKNCEIISINQQIIGEKLLNAPKEFMYCGNIVPADLLEKDKRLISEISIELTKSLCLKGINGFDFVLKNHYPYLMEINPRIPGSIRASEEILDINLLDLHVKSFKKGYWNYIKNKIKSKGPEIFATKLIIFAPKRIKVSQIKKINSLNYVHDKTREDKEILKGSPICSILYKTKEFSKSYFGAFKIANKIKDIIK